VCGLITYLNKLYALRREVAQGRCNQLWLSQRTVGLRILEKVVRLKKKARANMLVLPKDSCVGSDCAKGNDYIQIPATPIEVMQKVGRELGIEPYKLTKEKLVKLSWWQIHSRFKMMFEFIVGGTSTCQQKFIASFVII
jgi:hypothetical protein